MRSNRAGEPARGTVAQVLASARASLKEPLARPFTPAETRQAMGPLDQRPSSAFHNVAEIWTAGADQPSTPSRKARRSALSRGQPTKPPDSPVASGAALAAPRPVLAPAPAWVKEMDALISLLDAEMTQVLRGGSSVGEPLGRVRLLLQHLWPTVEGMAGACGDGDERWVLQRNRLFSCLFRVLERRESDLRLFSARCVLRLLSAGRASTVPQLQLPKYEAAVCKVLFQLTQASRNDAAFFAAEGPVAPMLALLAAQSRAMLASGAPCRMVAPLHLAGALSNLSSAGERSAARLGSLGAVSVLCEVLRAGAKVGGSDAVGLLTHVAKALRNLALHQGHHRQLAACGAPELLCRLVKQHLPHDELVYHATRVLAKLSLHESMRHGINADANHVRALLELLDVKGTAWAEGPPGPAATPQATALLVRVAFALGNLTASNERNRALVGAALGGGRAVLRLLECAHQRHARQLEGRGARAAEEGKEGEGKEGEGQADEGKEGEGKAAAGKEGDGKAVESGASGELEELLVKLIRLLANLSISSEVGRLLVADARVAVLPGLLDVSLRHRREELLLNTASAVTNLSFYGEGPATNRLFALAPTLCAHLLDVLLHPNAEAVAEAARAFGNFSRDAHARALMAALRADEALVILLDHNSRDVAFAAAGALVNVGADPAGRAALTASGGAAVPNGCAKLVRLVRRFGTSDWALAAVACKALYNVLAPLAQASDASGGAAGGEDAFWTVPLLHASVDELLEVADLDDAHGAEFAAAGGALHRLTKSLLQRRDTGPSEYEELEDPTEHGHK